MSLSRGGPECCLGGAVVYGFDRFDQRRSGFRDANHLAV